MRKSGILEAKTEVLLFCSVFMDLRGRVGGERCGEMKLSNTHWTASTLLPRETMPVQTSL